MPSYTSEGICKPSVLLIVIGDCDFSFSDVSESNIKLSGKPYSLARSSLSLSQSVTSLAVSAKRGDIPFSNSLLCRAILSGEDFVSPSASTLALATFLRQTLTALSSQNIIIRGILAPATGYATLSLNLQRSHRIMARACYCPQLMTSYQTQWKQRLVRGQALRFSFAERYLSSVTATSILDIYFSPFVQLPLEILCSMLMSIGLSSLTLPKVLSSTPITIDLTSSSKGRLTGEYLIPLPFAEQYLLHVTGTDIFSVNLYPSIPAPPEILCSILMPVSLTSSTPLKILGSMPAPLNLGFSTLLEIPYDISIAVSPASSLFQALIGHHHIPLSLVEQCLLRVASAKSFLVDSFSQSLLKTLSSTSIPVSLTPFGLRTLVGRKHINMPLTTQHLLRIAGSNIFDIIFYHIPTLPEILCYLPMAIDLSSTTTHWLIGNQPIILPISEQYLLKSSSGLLFNMDLSSLLQLLLSRQGGVLIPVDLASSIPLRTLCETSIFLDLSSSSLFRTLADTLITISPASSILRGAIGDCLIKFPFMEQSLLSVIGAKVIEVDSFAQTLLAILCETPIPVALTSSALSLLTGYHCISLLPTEQYRLAVAGAGIVYIDSSSQSLLRVPYDIPIIIGLSPIAARGVTGDRRINFSFIEQVLPCITSITTFSIKSLARTLLEIPSIVPIVLSLSSLASYYKAGVIPYIDVIVNEIVTPISSLSLLRDIITLQLIEDE